MPELILIGKLGGTGGPGGTVTPDSIVGASATGKAVLTGDAAAARTAIGAVTLGNTSTTAKAGDWKPTPDDIDGASTVGKDVIRAASASAARSAIGAGTSNLALGTTSTTAKAGNWQPSPSEVTGTTTTGRSLMTATNPATARATIEAASAADLANLADVVANNSTTLPAGSVMRAFYTGSAWPARPTSRTDISVEWIDLTGSAPSATMPSGYLSTIDTFWQRAVA